MAERAWRKEGATEFFVAPSDFVQQRAHPPGMRFTSSWCCSPTGFEPFRIAAMRTMLV
jgi:hypothetical protein